MKEKTSYEIKEVLCKYIDDMSGKDLTATTLDQLQKLTDTYKNMLKIEMLEQVSEEEGYSEKGYSRRHYDDSYRGNSYGGESYNRGGNYDGGSSLARRGEHYVRGHYSRGRMYDDDVSMRYDRRNSYADSKDTILHHLESLMNQAKTEQDREAIMRCMDEIEMA